MTARLPTVAGDNGTWGTLLNDFLTVGHNADGTTIVDASAVTYTPADNTKWTSSADPGNTNSGLDQLATRVKQLESSTSIINDRRWVRGNTANSADDEFNDGTLTGWTRVDNTGHDGYVTWVEGGDVLSGKVGNSADAAAELHAQMKNISFSVGDTIQTCLVGMGSQLNYPHASLVMADGTTYGSGTQAVFHTFWSFAAEATGLGINPSTWTGYNTRASTTDFQSQFLKGAVHLRIQYSAVNEFKFYYSPDAIQWMLIETRSITMTPTCAGLAIGGWTTTTPFLFSFEYFRVNAP